MLSTRRQLFEIDSANRFFSPKLIIYMQPYLAMKAQCQVAGKKSTEARKIKMYQHEYRDRRF